jgi:hypothetical protein
MWQHLCFSKFLVEACQIFERDQMAAEIFGQTCEYPYRAMDLFLGAGSFLNHDSEFVLLFSFAGEDMTR